MAGSCSSSQDFYAEIFVFFLGLVFVSEKQKKKSLDCGYIGTCNLLSVLKKECVEITE